jgi:hypothetical protein
VRRAVAELELEIVLAVGNTSAFDSTWTLSLTVTAVAPRKITGFVSPPITFHGESLTPLFVRFYVTAWWTTEAVVLVSTAMTFLSKWHNLVARRPDERSNHD